MLVSRNHLTSCGLVPNGQVRSRVNAAKSIERRPGIMEPQALLSEPSTAKNEINPDFKQGLATLLWRRNYPVMTLPWSLLCSQTPRSVHPIAVPMTPARKAHSDPGLSPGLSRPVEIEPNVGVDEEQLFHGPLRVAGYKSPVESDIPVVP
jgi:hypothetical protein